MQTSVSRSLRKQALAACAVAALAAPAAASAAPVVADLHVEAGGKALASSSYLTDATSVKTDRSQPACGGTGQTKTLPGATATGVLVDAAKTTKGLRPLRLSDKFEFGLLLCGVGSFTASDTAFWLYKVNRVAPEVAGEQFSLKRRAKVLWYFQDTVANVNTGSELAVTAPARARTGRAFTVSVSAYTASGARSAAAGARVAWNGGSATTDATGRASVTVARGGELRLRATRGADIPSAVQRTCVARRLSGCSPVRGLRLTGTAKADSLKGSAGPDAISAGGGSDRVDVRRGRADVIRCGSGRDRVRMSRDDKAARDCEVVIRAGKKVRG